MGTRGSFPGVKRPGREADHSSLSRAEVTACVELYLHAFMAWCFVKHRDNFTFIIVSTVHLFGLRVTERRVENECFGQERGSNKEMDKIT
jgi:hypothetical protein